MLKTLVVLFGICLSAGSLASINKVDHSLCNSYAGVYAKVAELRVLGLNQERALSSIASTLSDIDFGSDLKNRASQAWTSAVVGYVYSGDVKGKSTISREAKMRCMKKYLEKLDSPE